MEDGAHFVGREDDRKTLSSPRTDDVVQPGQRILQYESVQEQESAEGLVLGRSTDMLVGSEMSKERVHVVATHRCGMPLVVKEDEALDPACIRFFSPAAVMSRSQLASYPVHELRFVGHTGRGSLGFAKGRSMST